MNTYEDNYRKLQRDIESLEEEIKELKAFLEDNYNVSYSPKVKPSASFDSDGSDAQIDIDEAIRRGRRDRTTRVAIQSKRVLRKCCYAFKSWSIQVYIA